MESSVALNLAQSFYIAYYGRPGDPSGLLFWSSQISSSGGLLQIRDDFGNSEEFNERFGNLSNIELVNNLYQQMFARDAEVEGLNFWATALNESRTTLASVALEILNGAQGGDVRSFQNKLEAANYFTASLDTEIEIQNYQNLNAAQTAANLLKQVNKETNTLERFKDIVDQANGQPGSGEAPEQPIDEVADETPLPPPLSETPEPDPIEENPTLGDQLDGVGDVLAGVVDSTGNTFGDNLGSVTDGTGDVLDDIIDETGNVVDDVGGVIGDIIDSLLGNSLTQEPISDDTNIIDELLGDDGLLGGLLGGSGEESEIQPADSFATVSLAPSLIGMYESTYSDHALA